MEIFVSEKESFGNEVIHTQNSWKEKLVAPENERMRIKSLEDHDNEIRQSERQKVIAELEGWVNEQLVKFIYDYNTYDGRPVTDKEFINKLELLEKLKELKGEK